MRPRNGFLAVLLGILFLVQSGCFLSRPGIGAAELHWATLQSALYTFLLFVAHPGPVTLRLPMLIAGALAVVAFYRLTDRLGGAMAASAGGLLFATDTSLLMSTRLDTAGVTLGRLFLLAGCLFVLRFWKDAGRATLAIGFFFWGVSCACKPEFTWVLCGIAVAASLVFWKEVRAVWGIRNILPAAAGLVPGIVLFLVSLLAGRTPSRSIQVLPTSPLALIDGSAWFGYVFREQPGTWGVGPQGILENICLRFSNAFAQPRHNLLAITFCLAILGGIAGSSVSGLTDRRPLRFSLLALISAAAFCQIRPYAPFNVLLLWPLPHLLFALLFAALIKRWFMSAVPLCAVLVAVVFSSIAVTATCYSRMLLFGGTPSWTEATYNLADNFDVHDARHLRILSPGIEEPLQFLKRGSLPIVFNQESSDTLYIARIDFDTQSLGVAPRQIRFLRYVQDFQGRSVFELFRLE